ncbi:MAG: hypothetical protein J0G96_14105 [Flavobacteriia bacterium]|nr:hypothetical protein [Flavobacteriia bacterium]OJX39123.1 MAG: hypothetical protein BGO87_03835 [Flavobacteriia bacterium 40-80]
MKTLTLIFLFLSVLGTSTAPVNISDALKQHKIKIKTSFNQLGKDGIALVLTNPGTQTISIKIPAGTIFHPESDEEQTLMNVEEMLISLAPQQTKKINTGGYCTMLKKHCPKSENAFKIEETNNEKLLSFIDFLKTNTVSPDNYQAAIWALTDNEEISSILPLTEADKKLREHIAKLTNRKNPWYSSEQQVQAEQGRPIQRNRVDIQGELFVKLQENTEFTVSVENAAHEVKLEMPGTHLIEKNVENSFSFKVSVKEWEIGKYSVVLRKKSNKAKIAFHDFNV